MYRHPVLLSLLACVAMTSLLQTVAAAPVFDSLSTTDRQRLADILGRLDGTLTDLSSFLRSDVSPDSQQQQQTLVEDELPALTANYKKPSRSHETDDSRHSLTAELDDESDADDDMSLKDVLRYLVLLKQRKTTHGSSAVKRDHDIPFPIDGGFGYDFRD